MYCRHTLFLGLLISTSVINFCIHMVVSEITDKGYGTNYKKGLPEHSAHKRSCTSSVTTINGVKATCVGDLILDEDFQESSLSTSQWIIEQWIPSYTPPKCLFNTFENNAEHVFINNDVLHIRPTIVTDKEYSEGIFDLTAGCTAKMMDECYSSSAVSNALPVVRSAKIISRIAFQYGRVDIKAKLPEGEWIFPIIQLEQQIKENGENSPTVWLAYSRGNINLVANDEDDLGGSLIFAGPVLYQIEPLRSQKLATKRHSRPFFEDFHLYTLDWQPGKMVFSIDYEEYGSVDLNTFHDGIDIRSGWIDPEAPYDKEYILSLGVAVGGNIDFPDGYRSSGRTKPWLNLDKHSLHNFWTKRNDWSRSWSETNTTLEIDYVKITAI